MLVDQLSLIVYAAVVVFGGALLTVRVWIREEARTRRTEIVSKGTDSKHKAAAIEAANRPWWRRPR